MGNFHEVLSFTCNYNSGWFFLFIACETRAEREYLHTH